MGFRRRPTEKWRREVPGARWFKADLQVRTIDDHAGGRAKTPAGLSGDPADPAVLARYARLFLQAAVKNGIQVIGLTPHSPRAGEGPATSAVWRIVEEWNAGADDDGAPFREKIHSVFPGFEPSFDDGKAGLHLLFLFDPEIGRERYLKAFDLVTNGVSPWKDGTLQMSTSRAEEAFDRLREFCARENRNETDGNRAWRYLVLAPHADGGKGLLDALKSQVLQFFDHGSISGLELGDDKTPEDTLRDRPWLREGMETYRQAFFHASDACDPDEIGRRHTWIKLARPRIAALRQAFVANDSRVRLGFEKGEGGQLRPIDDPPDVAANGRPWLREATIRGGASFFGGRKDGAPVETRFPLSPDLTCIIGGSMTGKSAFLDGLRVHIGAPPPHDESVRGQVEARGRDVFAVGSPSIELDCPGQDRVAPPRERWPARFFAQNELQRLAQENAAVEGILARLVPSEIDEIDARGAELASLDERLADLAGKLAKHDETAAEAEQAHRLAADAKKELDTFAEAGVDRLHRVSRARGSWKSVADKVRGEIGEPLANLVESMREIDLPPMDGDGAEKPADRPINWRKRDLDGRQRRIADDLEAAARKAAKWVDDIAEIAGALGEREAAVRAEVVRALAERGHDAATLNEIRQLTRRAALLPAYDALLGETRGEIAAGEDAFARAWKRRRALVDEQRSAFDRVAGGVEREFGGRIRVRRFDDADTRPLDAFLRSLRQRSVTRWWNDLDSHARPSPETLTRRLKAGSLADVGMTGAVQDKFRESLTRSRRRELAALRCPDRYVVELRMDDGSYRALNDLSGGQRVSVLLSLLLETTDDRPLAIDQPEDELDNKFLWETVLPALKKLRGRRQVIVATHNANIVVNGDADMVIQLDATSRRGRVACAGAIEEPAVRDAILRTVDGGEEAFRLRRQKYGF